MISIFARVPFSFPLFSCSFSLLLVFSDKAYMRNVIVSFSNGQISVCELFGSIRLVLFNFGWIDFNRIVLSISGNSIACRLPLLNGAITDFAGWFGWLARRTCCSCCVQRTVGAFWDEGNLVSRSNGIIEARIINECKSISWGNPAGGREVIPSSNEQIFFSCNCNSSSL